MLTYHITRDEGGYFEAQIHNEEWDLVRKIDQNDLAVLIDEGTMSDKYDIGGLEAQLIRTGAMSESDTLVDGADAS